METICHFEFTIANLATNRLLTIGLLKVWAIPIPISATKDVICCSNGYIYSFFG